MLKSFFIWWHHIAQPHCAECIEEDRVILELEQEKYVIAHTCHTCESLKNENVFLREQIRELQNHILNPKVPIETVINIDEMKPINSARKPFSVIRNELERKDRELAKVRDEQLKQHAAKPDSVLTNDEGKIDPIKVQNELENMNKEITNAS